MAGRFLDSKLVQKGKHWGKGCAQKSPSQKGKNACPLSVSDVCLTLALHLGGGVQHCILGEFLKYERA